MVDRLVIDASVVVKWFLSDELERQLADDLLLLLLADKVEMHAPRVLLSEVCGVFTKACLSRISPTGDRRLELNLAEECLARLYELPIQFSDPDASSAAAALKMAVKYHKTFNDMTYVELAGRINGQWCTADRKFFEALPVDFPLNLTLKLSALNSLENTQ